MSEIGFTEKYLKPVAEHWKVHTVSVAGSAAIGAGFGYFGSDSSQNRTSETLKQAVAWGATGLATIPLEMLMRKVGGDDAVRTIFHGPPAVGAHRVSRSHADAPTARRSSAHVRGLADLANDDAAEAEPREGRPATRGRVFRERNTLGGSHPAGRRTPEAERELRARVAAGRQAARGAVSSSGEEAAPVPAPVAAEVPTADRDARSSASA